MDSLKFHLKDYILEQNCSFGNFMLDLLDINSSLYTSNSEIVIFFIDINALEINFDELLNAIEKFVSTSNKTLIVNSISYLPNYIDSFLNITLENELKYNLNL